MHERPYGYLYADFKLSIPLKLDLHLERRVP